MKVPEGVTEYDFDWEVQARNMEMVAEKPIPQGSVGVQQNPSEKIQVNRISHYDQKMTQITWLMNLTKIVWFSYLEELRLRSNYNE